MKKYIIKQPDKDFIFLRDINMIRGSRKKRAVYDIKNKQIAMFKYEEYNCTESCSEKIAYELSKLLGYKCAKIELARDENGILGILNYMFTDSNSGEHNDAIAYINNNEDKKDFYTLENIKECLDKTDINLFKDFLKILIFDTFIGETDRHEENWGILLANGKYQISPLYDNGCNLLREFKDEKILNKYYEGNKDFNAYINRSKTCIYDSKTKRRYTHFKLLEKIIQDYNDDVKDEINKLKLISNEQIEEIVNKIPDELMTSKHKKLIIKYLLIRKEKMLKMIE